MANFKANGAKFRAKNGGTIRNCNVDLTDVEMNFEEDNVNIITDESVALAECENKGKGGWFKEYAFPVVSGVSIAVIGGVILYFFGFS